MKIGIIICDRYRECAGGKCFRAIRERAGAFARYSREEPLEVVGYTSRSTILDASDLMATPEVRAAYE